MTVDINNNLWVCRYNGGGISVYNTNGNKIHQILLPAKNITNCIFGGKLNNELFISTARKDMKKKAEEEKDEPNEELVDIDLEDPEVQAATEKIQAGYKGMRTRRELKDKKEAQEKDEEVVDIDLEDPEVKAATTAWPDS